MRLKYHFISFFFSIVYAVNLFKVFAGFCNDVVVRLHLCVGCHIAAMTAHSISGFGSGCTFKRFLFCANYQKEYWQNSKHLSFLRVEKLSVSKYSKQNWKKRFVFLSLEIFAKSVQKCSRHLLEFSAYLYKSNIKLDC